MDIEKLLADGHVKGERRMTDKMENIVLIVKWILKQVVKKHDRPQESARHLVMMIAKYIPSGAESVF